MALPMPSESSRRATFGEIKRDEPAIVGRTRRKFGAERAARQKVAIGLSKARTMDRSRRRSHSR